MRNSCTNVPNVARSTIVCSEYYFTNGKVGKSKSLTGYAEFIMFYTMTKQDRAGERMDVIVHTHRLEKVVTHFGNADDQSKGCNNLALRTSRYRLHRAYCTHIKYQ